MACAKVGAWLLGTKPNYAPSNSQDIGEIHGGFVGEMWKPQLDDFEVEMLGGVKMRAEWR
jgi:hypothetical protein